MLRFQPKKGDNLARNILCFFFVLLTIIFLPLSIYQTATQGLLKALPMYLIIIFVLSIFAFFLYAMRNLHYEITEDSVILSYFFRKKTIHLADITGIKEHVPLGNSYSVAGLSDAPGFYVGNFHTAHLGQVYLSATDNRDVLVIQAGDNLYGITPENQEEFQSALENALDGQHITSTGEIHPDLVRHQGGKLGEDKKALGLIYGGLLLNIVVFILTALVISHLPDKVPFNNGDTLRYGSPKEYFFMSGFTFYIWCIISLVGYGIYHDNRRGAYIVWVIDLAVVLMITIINIVVMLGNQ